MSLPPFLTAVESLGHVVFKKGHLNLNLIGVRSSVVEAGRFDDHISAWYKDSNGAWVSHWWTATTDPGLYWLKNPMRVSGTAIMVPGQYPRLWKIGLHRGYKAFEQVGDVRVYRDNNRNEILDMGPSASTEYGDFSLNGHAADSDPWDDSDRDRTNDLIKRWGGGCQVWARSSDLRQAVLLGEQSRDLGYGDRLTYTLVRATNIYQLAA